MARPKKNPGARRKARADSPARALLDWYEKNARDLPWRVRPAARAAGARPDPYAVWLSEVMLQQTTVATVRPRFEAFLERWPNIAALAAAPLDDVLGEWAGLGYYARARNLHKCAAAVAGRGGFPDTEEELRALPGIGAYTAAAIAAIAFDRPAVVVDGNIERVAARLFAIDAPLPAAKTEIRARIGEISPDARCGDFAQALMDLGAMICTPRAPKCSQCPLNGFCAACAREEPEAFPKRAAKSKRPTRFGAAYALFNAKGEVLLERRPEKGLLGGMLALPCTEWTERPPSPAPPVNAAWRAAGTVNHTFTHFHLKLETYAAKADARLKLNDRGRWLRPETIRLPTVMKKALEMALAARGDIA